MQTRPPDWRDRLVDGEPRQLMSKSHGAGLGHQHPRVQARVQLIQDVPGHTRQEPDLRLGRHHGDCLQQRPGGWRQARGASEHGIAHVGGNLGIAGREGLGDKERIARRFSVQVDRIDPVRLGQLGHRRRRERRHLQAGNRLCVAQLPQQQAQRMRSVQLIIPVAGQHQRRDGFNSASEQSQDVERGLVCPVHVLHDQNRRRARSQLAHERRDHLVRATTALGELLELAPGDQRNVDKGSERSRGEERVAGPQQDLRPARAIRRSAGSAPSCRRLTRRR